MGAGIAHFLNLVAESPPMENVFNPWRDVDEAHDIGPEAPRIRAGNLRHYIAARLESARRLFIGEALGYQGGHFSGIAMTSERTLLGFQRARGILPGIVLPGVTPRRTSRPEIKPLGFSEPTGTIVWETLLKSGIEPDEFVLWNAFPWHPFDPGRGILSNRRPGKGELARGEPVLRAFLGLFPGRRVIAVGRVSAAGLDSLGVDCREVRHPVQGGSREFKSQVRKILERG